MGIASGNCLDYRGVVALNNMAIRLFERRAFHQALDTFRDAAESMKNVFERQHGVRSIVSTIPLVSKRIDKASKRMAQSALPVNHSDELRNDVSNSVAYHDGELIPVHHLFSKINAMHTRNTSGPGGNESSRVETQPIMIAMEWIAFDDFTSSTGRRDLDLESVLLLQNFAVSHQFVALHVETSEDDKGKLFKSARRLFEMCLTILSNEHCLETLSSKEAAQAYKTRLQLALVVLSHLKALQVQMGDRSLARRSQTNIDELFDVLTDLMDHEHCNVCVNSCNAAAA